MKKIFTLLAATTLFAGAAFAQETADPFPTQVTFSSPNGTVQTDPETGELYLPLSQMNTTVTLTLDKAEEIVGVTPFLAIYSGTFGFSEAVYAEPIIPADTNPIVVTLDAAKWGNPYMGNFYTTIMLTYLDAEGDYVLRDDEPIFFQMPCVTPNVFSAELQYVYPNNDWSEETFAEAYDNGIITFAFTNPIGFDSASNVATVTYNIDGEEDSITLIQDDCVVGWNSMDGFYDVRFRYASEDYAAEDISSITITLNGVKSEVGDNNPSVAVAPVVLLNTPQANPAPRKAKGRMEESLDGNTLVNVYNLQGMLVKENVSKSVINELPAGLYIVDGKKVVVR